MSKQRLVGLAILVLVVLASIPGCRVSPRSADVTDSTNLEPLMHLCLSNQIEMALTPIGDEEGFFFVPFESVQHWSEDDYTLLAPSSTIVVQGAEYRETFDNEYLRIWGTVTAASGIEHQRVLLNRLFDDDWLRTDGKRAGEGRSITINPQELPIQWQFVSLCPPAGSQPPKESADES